MKIKQSDGKLQEEFDDRNCQTIHFLLSFKSVGTKKRGLKEEIEFQIRMLAQCYFLWKKCI